MNKFTLAAVIAVFGLSLAASSTAEAAGPVGKLATNGTQINGVALDGLKVKGIELRAVTVVTKHDKEAQK